MILRVILRWTIRVALLLLSVESLARIADWSGEVEWWSLLLSQHPRLQAIVNGPLFPIGLTVMCLLAVYGEGFLRQPDIKARFSNSRIIADRHKVTIGSVFDAMDKKPGWDDEKISSIWFVEVSLVNDSDTPTTIHGVEARMKINGRVIPCVQLENMNKFEIDTAYNAALEPCPPKPPSHRSISDLLQITHNVPLNRGIGYIGWVAFTGFAVSQKEISKALKIDLWIVDAFNYKHKLTHKKGSDKNWDMSFAIMEKTGPRVTVL